MKNRLQKLYENKRYFEILEIQPTLDLKIINRAFRMTALKYHPEKGGSHDEMVIIVDIMQKLRDKNYLQQYFRYTVTGEAFNENNFQFETEFRTANPENLQNYMENIIHSMSESIKKAYCDEMNDVVEQAIFADPFVDLRESINSPFEVSFYYRHKSRYGEIALVIREELDDGEYREQHFQHAITDVEFIDKVERTTYFLANPENLEKKVSSLIQKINGDTVKRPNKELFDKLKNWMSQQLVVYRERSQTEIQQDYGDNTRRGMSQKWLNQITEHQIIKQNSVDNLRRLASGAMLYFFDYGSCPSPLVTTQTQPEYHSEHFEIDYFLLSLLAVASFTIATALLYYICQKGKTIDSDNSCERSERKCLIV